MLNKSYFLKFFLSIIITIFSFFINFYYANIGLYPIDTFSFFDSGYNVLNGYHPIKDYWVISGIFEVDYLTYLILNYIHIVLIDSLKN